MQFYDALEICGKTSGTSMQQVSAQLGHAKVYVAGAKSRGSVPSVDNAARMLGVCGYALCAIPHSDVTESMLQITPNSKE